MSFLSLFIIIGNSLASCWYYLTKTNIIIKGEKILVVIAHPDDECMFFAPTILKLIKLGKQVHVHSFSNGSSSLNNLSTIRTKELEQSCKVLGVQKVTLGKFKDGFDKVWNVTDMTLELKALECDSLVTFDNYGVSGHPNHISTMYGVRQFAKEKKIPVYELVSVPIYRKYIGLFDLLFSVFCSFSVVVPFSSIYKPFLAMKQHKSQLVWFRKLYVLFSRYMIMNNYKVYENK